MKPDPGLNLTLRRAVEADWPSRLLPGFPIKPLVRALRVVEVQIRFQAALGLRYGIVSFQVDLLVFDGTPQPLNKHVVSPAPLAIHADPDTLMMQQASKFLAGKLAALIRVKNLWGALFCQGFVDCIQAEVRDQRVGQPPSQYAPREPVDHGHQIDKAFRHRDRRDVSRPGLVAARDRQIAR